MSIRNERSESPRVALVTGGTRGIGQAIAAALRASGHRVIVLARNAANDDAADMLEADLGVPGAAATAVQRVTETTGRLDVLVNNAGTQHVAPIDEYPLEEWNRLVALNLTAPFEAIRAALPIMRAQGFGRIVNMASVHGLIASPGKGPYAATKHGLVGLTKAVALEVAGVDITCNAVCPGFVDTPLVAAQIDALAASEGIAREDAIERLVATRQPSGAMITPEAVASLVRYLVSDEAASINGAALPIDEAWTSR